MAKKKENQSNGLMRVLQIVQYKDGHILIRKIGKEMFVWDVFFREKFYSSYIVMKPVKGQKELNEEEIAEVVKMCYAGAASTIDYQRGDKISKKEEDIVKQFEAGRKSAGGIA